MSDTNFLRSVAAFCDSAGAGVPLENLVFVLPNKRSAMFLKSYVCERARGGMLMLPRFMTMNTFVSLHSPYPEGGQRELLFALYEAYRRAMRECGREGGIREFDSFIFWGDMILNDFDDIDRSLVNADDLFRNLRDVKEIQADYLDEEQKEVIRRVWGESRLTAEADRFWLHVRDDSDESLSAKFVYLWEILSVVYHRYHEILREKKISSPGNQYRLALDAIRAIDHDSVPPDTRYVFVGFNDLSTAETLIFERLRSLDAAWFFWDTAPLALVGETSGHAEPKPLKRLRALVENFPMPAGYQVPPCRVPETQVEVLAVPSNVGQAKAMTAVLDAWKAEDESDVCAHDAHKAILTKDINTAVVLPDQGLLLPALLSVPSWIDSINITMGLAYRTTTFASLLHSIISMQLRAREIRGETNYFYEDVNAVLSHPHIRTIAGAEADTVSELIVQEKLYNIPVKVISGAAPALDAVFAPVRNLGSVNDVAAYLLTLLDWLGERLSAVSGDDARFLRGFEHKAITFFREEVESIAQLAGSYGVTMNDRTFLHLFERIFTTRGLTVNGSPLAGLQLLGVLETRALDFENLIVLSMNEKIFPRKQYTRTMIPAALRAGFGLPDFDSLEWTYAYCFYRLISRARRVTLMYDSRTDGLGNGEKSRYIYQMQYLMPSLKVTERTLSYASRSSRGEGISVDKTPEVLAYLDKFRAGVGKLRLSASALKAYKACPMKFYLQYVRNMRGSDELSDFLQSSQFGTAVHNTIQGLFEPLKGQLISSATYDAWLAPGNDAVDRLAREHVVRQRFPKATDTSAVHLTVDISIAIQLVASIARENLRAERDCYCAGGAAFTFAGNELKIAAPWHIAPGLDVNFYMSIDRVDSMAPHALRFVDFKTGDEDVTVRSLDGLIGGDYKKDGFFQLFIYSQAYRDIVDPQAQITPMLHCMRSFSAGKDIELLRVGGKEVTAYTDYASEFRPMLQAFVEEIFNPEVPFTQCADSGSCRYCKFKTMCGRIEAGF